MAINNYGNASSEPVEVDVMDIVQPHSPGNMTLTLMGVKDNPYFLVKWEAPHDIDTRSGWVTLSYEVRVKQEQVSDWEVYNVGKQKELSIFSPKPGENYTIQVRCKLDQGLWSDWNPPVFIQIPNNSVIEKPFLIVTAVFSTLVVLITVGILTAKRKHVKHFLLPPVPGPKIKGFDGQLLKTVKPEDISNIVNFQGIFPVPECPDHVEYVVVLDSEEDSENSAYKVHLERQGADQNMSKQKTWNELNIADRSDKWKFTALAHNCQNSDPESTALNTPQHSNQYSTYDVPQHKPDISHENMARSSETSCTCNHEQNQVSVTPYGLMECAEQKPREDCKQKLTIEKEEDYSKVSGIYRETVLVIQKDSSPVQRHKTVNNDPCKKTKIKITLSVKDSTDPQEYVATSYDMF